MTLLWLPSRLDLRLLRSEITPPPLRLRRCSRVCCAAVLAFCFFYSYVTYVRCGVYVSFCKLFFDQVEEYGGVCNRGFVSFCKITIIFLIYKYFLKENAQVYKCKRLQKVLGVRDMPRSRAEGNRTVMDGEGEQDNGKCGKRAFGRGK